MNPFKIVFPLSALAVFFALSLTTLAQSDATSKLEPSYEVSLQVLIGSNESGSKSDVPSNLSSITKHLKSNFSFSDYRLANTFLGRISNTGNIEYKSISNILGQETDAEPPTFVEWSLGNFRSVESGFQARLFRFGAKVPVRTGSTRNESGRVDPIINYESVGLTMIMFGLPANTPTLIGTISMPRTTGTIFLIATIRSANL